jgi:hypothetical protein
MSLIGSTAPDMLKAITENKEAFLALLMEPMDGEGAEEEDEGDDMEGEEGDFDGERGALLTGRGDWKAARALRGREAHMPHPLSSPPLSPSLQLAACPPRLWRR